MRPIRLALAVPLLAAGLVPAGAPRASAGDVEAGRRVYERSCQMCHGATGLGAFPGVPSLRAPDGPLTLPDEVLFERIANGFQSPGSRVGMPPKGGDPNLTEADIADALAYMHREFGVDSRAPMQ